jgi:glutathione S-transferase
MANVKVYGFPLSGFTRTARMALLEKDVAFDFEGLDFGSDAHRALHPFARMPILDHDGFVLYETSAIIRYVDQAFDGPALQPADLRAGARMEQWISTHNHYFIATIVWELLLPRLLYQPQGKPVDEAKIAEAVPEMEHQLAVAEQTLSHAPYFAGDAMSLADLLIIPTVFLLGLIPEGERALPNYPAVGRWVETMTARPSFAATIPPMPA